MDIAHRSPVWNGYTKVPRFPDISENGCILSGCKRFGTVGTDGGLLRPVGIGSGLCGVGTSGNWGTSGIMGMVGKNKKDVLNREHPYIYCMRYSGLYIIYCCILYRIQNSLLVLLFLPMIMPTMYCLRGI